MKILINEILAGRYYSTDLLTTSNYFRNIALAVDQSPVILSEHLSHPGIIKLCFDRDSECLVRTKMLEALAYGDAGVLLACPGPSLSGLMLRELGSVEQRNIFFNFVESNKSTTFLAVTEPNKGSDAGNMQTHIKKINGGDYRIYGEKWLVGHGADAALGVLVARNLPGPLGIVAILLTPDVIANADDTLYREHLKVSGLRGARLSRLVFNGLKISEENILGGHLNVMRRGMMAVMKTFNRMRPGVAAFALGHAQAVIDYLKTHLSFNDEQKSRIEQLDVEANIVRLILYKSAAQIDENPLASEFSSLAKAKSTQLAEKVSAAVLELFAKEHLQHPLLLKWNRDVYGYEYMEGTSYIQHQHIARHYINHVVKLSASMVQ